jgi:lipopolysaccharide transport system permease protein
VESASIDAAPASEIVISPPSRWSSLHLGELWAHRELVYFLTKRELQVRYKQSLFGIGWAILQPLTFAFIFALFFAQIIDTSAAGLPFAVYAIAGLVPWQFTSGAITNGATSLVQDANLISKVYFPRLALPISKALSLIVDLVIAMPVVILLGLVYGVGIETTAPLVVAFLALGVVFAFALGTLFAAVNVKYRDVTQIVPVFVQVMFFVSPIILLPEQIGIEGVWSYVYAINPMASVIEGVRWSLFGATYPGTPEIAISVASTILLLAVGLRYFQKTEQTFADVI